MIDSPIIIHDQAIFEVTVSHDNYDVCYCNIFLPQVDRNSVVNFDEHAILASIYPYYRINIYLKLLTDELDLDRVTSIINLPLYQSEAAVLITWKENENVG